VILQFCLELGDLLLDMKGNCNWESDDSVVIT